MHRERPSWVRGALHAPPHMHGSRGTVPARPRQQGWPLRHCVPGPGDTSCCGVSRGASAAAWGVQARLQPAAGPALVACPLGRPRCQPPSSDWRKVTCPLRRGTQALEVGPRPHPIFT